MNPKTLHSGSTVAAEGASFDEVMLSNVFVLEVGAHRNLTLKPSVAYWAMIRQALGVRREMFCQVIFSEKPLLAYAAFVRLHSCMPHLVPAHIRAI